MALRTGDSVIVIAGNDKGRTGTVKQVDRAADRVIVEGINLRWKHRKPSQQNPKGERVQRETAIHASNVMHLDPATGRGVRRRPAAETKPTKKPESKTTKKSGAKAAKK